ncbi:MAG: hypothetical protein JO211_11740, partial [Acidobacteriaceae bacterium]|nr:hypothetical protein [Acidobacteriaceae bacterium]
QDGREERTLELINNKAIKPGRKRWRAPLTTEGEFGILLDRVLGEGSPAEYHWHGWDAVRGRRVAVFDFCIDRDHSTLSLTINEFAHATFGYHGSLYADPETGAIWRITDASDELPRQLQTRSISTAIDYDEIPIGDANYVLPTAAEVLVTTQSTSIRNEIRFKNYRKFEADSTITFGPAPAANTSKSQPQP